MHQDSYIQFLHQEEEELLFPILRLYPPERILNLGCGTGRFMKYCQYGVDTDESMLTQAISKYRDKNIHIASLTNTNFPNTSFDVIIAIDLLSHLSQEKAKAVFQEVVRLLRPNGKFIFTVLSKTRQTWLKNAVPPHSTYYTLKEVLEMLGDEVKYVKHEGMMFLPLHRIPAKARKYFLPLDTFLSKIISSDYSSYMMVVVEKKS